jgi:hypothetical protein
MEAALLGVVGSLNIVLLTWLSLEVRSMRNKLDTKVEDCDLEACRRACHEEHLNIWSRVNRHAHCNDGKVVID